MVAWIAGKRETFGVTVNSFSVHCATDAWVIVRWPFPKPPFGNRIRLVNLSSIAASDYGRIPHVAIPHYLIVAIFALFYGVLKWVYRKREVAGE